MSIVRRSSSSNIFDPFSLDLWDPFREFDAFCSLAEARPPGYASDASAFAFAGARFNWKEAPEAHVFKVDIPSMKKEAKVEVEDSRVLRISGERSKEQEEKTDRWHHVERSVMTRIRRNPPRMRIR